MNIKDKIKARNAQIRAMREQIKVVHEILRSRDLLHIFPERVRLWLDRESKKR